MPIIVYVLTNPAIPGMVKIGLTSRKDLSERMRELHTTGVPLPFECFRALEVEDDNVGKRLEDALHQAFTRFRVNPNREFFELEPDQAAALLDVFPGNDVTPQIKKETGELDPTNRAASDRLKRKRRPNLNFQIMGIAEGSLLKNRVTGEEATIVAAKKVRFRDEVMSLTQATRLARGGGSWAPQPDWTYRGRALSEIWRETMLASEEAED